MSTNFLCKYVSISDVCLVIATHYGLFIFPHYFDFIKTKKICCSKHLRWVNFEEFRFQLKSNWKHFPGISLKINSSNVPQMWLVKIRTGKLTPEFSLISDLLVALIWLGTILNIPLYNRMKIIDNIQNATRGLSKIWFFNKRQRFL